VLTNPGSRFFGREPSATNTQNPNPYPDGIFLPKQTFKNNTPYEDIAAVHAENSNQASSRISPLQQTDLMWRKISIN
jgi:hypothetical protein